MISNMLQPRSALVFFVVTLAPLLACGGEDVSGGPPVEATGGSAGVTSPTGGSDSGSGGSTGGGSAAGGGGSGGNTPSGCESRGSAAGGSPGGGSGMEVVRQFPLNTADFPAGLEPPRMVSGDLDGDGQRDWVMTHGTLLARAYDSDGTEVWNVVRGNGVATDRVHEQPSSVVWDMDGDGKAEVLCTLRTPGATTYDLLIIDGVTGEIRESVTIPTEKIGGHLSIAYMTDPTQDPYVILKFHSQGGLTSETGGETDAEAWAFDKNLNSVWKTPIPRGGHYIWPYDLDGDGMHELLAGKFVLDENGAIIGTLDLGSDHADSLVVADVDPNFPGVEICTVGVAGVSLFRGDTYARIWNKTETNDPQWAFAAQLTASVVGRELEIKPRQTSPDTNVRVLDAQGNIIMTYQGVNLGGWMAMDYDGDRSTDEVLVDLGTIRDFDGNTIESNDWLPPGTYARYRLAHDVLGDEREEVVAWTNTTLFIGSNQSPFAAGSIPCLRDDRDYKLRAVNHSFRGTVYFPFGR